VWAEYERDLLVRANLVAQQTNLSETAAAEAAGLEQQRLSIDPRGAFGLGCPTTPPVAAPQDSLLESQRLADVLDALSRARERACAAKDLAAQAGGTCAPGFMGCFHLENFLTCAYDHNGVAQNCASRAVELDRGIRLLLGEVRELINALDDPQASRQIIRRSELLRVEARTTELRKQANATLWSVDAKCR
jgi:hypothetical protein